MIGLCVVAGCLEYFPQDETNHKFEQKCLIKFEKDYNVLTQDISYTDKEFSNGGVFLLTINNDWFVKRLRRRITGELDIISDNSKYPTETLKPDTKIEIAIKGRVLKNLSHGL